MERQNIIIGLILLTIIILILFTLFKSSSSCPTLPPVTECPSCPPPVECPTVPSATECPAHPPPVECPAPPPPVECPTVPPATECPSCPPPVECPTLPPATECPTCPPPVDIGDCIYMHPVNNGLRGEEIDKELFNKFPSHVDLREYTYDFVKDENGEYSIQNIKHKNNWCTYEYLGKNSMGNNLVYIKPAKNRYLGRLNGKKPGKKSSSYDSTCNYMDVDIPRDMTKQCTKEYKPICALVFAKHKHNDREGNEVITNVLIEKDFDNKCEAEAHGAVRFGHYGGCGSSICHNWNVDKKHELINPEDYYNL